jgi:uracil-DNA glycosylase
VRASRAGYPAGEDIQGEPFVGPAGRVLDQGLERAGITRAEAYVTNAVKHFRALVCLGATAAQALLGSSVWIGRDRGRRMEESDLAEHVTLTTHPSAILRQRGDADRAAAMDAFVEDLAHVARWLAHN